MEVKKKKMDNWARCKKILYGGIGRIWQIICIIFEIFAHCVTKESTKLGLYGLFLNSSLKCTTYIPTFTTCAIYINITHTQYITYVGGY